MAGRRRGRLVHAVDDLTEPDGGDPADRPPDSAVAPRGDPGRGDPTGQSARYDAWPIAKGQLGKPVEFGHKAQVADNEEGVVLYQTVEPGNSADAPPLEPAIEPTKRRTGRPPGP